MVLPMKHTKIPNTSATHAAIFASLEFDRLATTKRHPAMAIKPTPKVQKPIMDMPDPHTKKSPCGIVAQWPSRLTR